MQLVQAFAIEQCDPAECLQQLITEIVESGDQDLLVVLGTTVSSCC